MLNNFFTFATINTNKYIKQMIATKTKHKIESNVPLPEYKYPFDKLKVGQSFIAGEFSAELQRNMVNMGRYYGKKLSAKFTTGKHGNKLRVWRSA